MSTPEWVPKTEQPIVGGPTYTGQNGAGASIRTHGVLPKFVPNELYCLSLYQTNLVRPMDGRDSCRARTKWYNYKI